MAQQAQRLNDVRRHVLRGVVDHLTEVAERYLVGQPLRVIFIEGAPTAVLGLHRQQPAPSPRQRPLPALFVRQPRARQRHQDLGRVIRIRVEIILELERPAAGLHAPYLHLPVAAAQDLLAQQPAARPHQRRVVRRQARVQEPDHRQRRVPHRRKAGLRVEDTLVLHREGALEPLQPPAHHRIVQRVAPQFKGDERIHPRRLYAAPRSVRLLMRNDPALRRAVGRPS